MIDGSGPTETPDDREFHTETFSNARGWSAVRVTHGATGASAERARTEGLRSAVQAQRECIDELRAGVTAGSVTLDQDGEPTGHRPAADFDGLMREIALLRHRLDELEDEVSDLRGTA